MSEETIYQGYIEFCTRAGVPAASIEDWRNLYGIAPRWVRNRAQVRRSGGQAVVMDKVQPAAAIKTAHQSSD